MRGHWREGTGGWMGGGLWEKTLEGGFIVWFVCGDLEKLEES